MLAKAAKYRPAKYKKVSPTTSPITVSVSGETFIKKQEKCFKLKLFDEVNGINS